MKIDKWFHLYGHKDDIVFEEVPFEELPSAERKGEWISYINDGFVECPFCGSLTNCDSTEEMDTLHYCFNCGASMVRGKEDEIN